MDDDVLDAYPAELIDHDTKHFFQGALERRLVVTRCRSCGRWLQPAGPCCPDCWSLDVGPDEVSGRGRVYFGVRLHQGPAVPDVDYSTPYPVATVELDEQLGLRITAPVIDAGPDDLRPGTPVELAWIERSGVPYPAFRRVAS
jgi:hypothetical protein